MKALLGIFQFVFGCRHRQMSRVFTIKRRTYRVCFDCGQEFDLPGRRRPFGGSLEAPRWSELSSCSRKVHAFISTQTLIHSHVSYLAQTRNSRPVIL